MGTGLPFTSIYPDAPAGGGGGTSGGGLGSGNGLYPGMPEGATPFHRDVTITTATTTDIWAPTGPDRRLVVASAFISSDTAMRVAIVAENDVQGSRIVDQYVGANGGSSPNLIPVPYPLQTGQRVRVVTAGAGNVPVRVSGWEMAAG